ncbi:MAG: hypothetical protein JWQ64_2268 [Subtercola sp.]|nr:hypothetical protein [Subtercola sp.]
MLEPILGESPALCCTISLPCSPNPAWIERMTDDSEQIRRIIAMWEQAVQSRDLAGTLAHHASDIVMFDVPEPIQAIGLEQYRETWELFFAYSAGGEASFHLHELAVIVGDTVAVAHALLDAADDKCRLTMALQKFGDEWMIVHEHHSSPWPNPRETGQKSENPEAAPRP